jgi:hypothetical protein
MNIDDLKKEAAKHRVLAKHLATRDKLDQLTAGVASVAVEQKRLASMVPSFLLQNNVYISAAAEQALLVGRAISAASSINVSSAGQAQLVAQSVAAALAVNFPSATEHAQLASQAIAAASAADFSAATRAYVSASRMAAGDLPHAASLSAGITGRQATDMLTSLGVLRSAIPSDLREQARTLAQHSEAMLLWKGALAATMDRSALLPLLLKEYRSDPEPLAGSVSDVLGTVEVEEPLPSVAQVVKAVEAGMDAIGLNPVKEANPPIGFDIQALVDEIIARLPKHDGNPSGFRIIITSILMYLVFRSIEAALGGIGEVEYERWRNAEEDAARSQVESDQTQIAAAELKEIQRIRELLENPPHPGRITKQAHLRRSAAKGAESITILPAGTHVIEISRESGWAYVSVQLAEGTSEKGWVYGRFVAAMPVAESER